MADTHDPQAIKTLGAYHPPLLYVAGQVAQGDYIYSIDESSLNQEGPFLHVLRASDLETVGEYQLTLTAQYALMHWYWGMALDGNRLYVSGRTGVYMFDVSHPEKPALLAYHFEMNAWLNTVTAATVNGRRLVFTGEPSSGPGATLKVYDATDASQVTEPYPSIEFDGEEMTRLSWNGNALDLLTTDNAGTSWFYILTLNNAGLTIQCRMALPGWINVMAVHGTLVALVDSQGLIVLSTTNPNQPKMISQTSLMEGLGLTQIAFQGSRLLAIANTGSYQLISFDLSDPVHPIAVDVTAIPLADALSVSGQQIILSGNYSGVEILK